MPAGKHQVRFSFTYDGGDIGKGGTMSIAIDGGPVAERWIDKTSPVAFSIESVDVGEDTGMPVTPDYSANRFTGGRLGRVLVDFGKDDHSHMEDPESKYQRLMGRQ